MFHENILNYLAFYIFAFVFDRGFGLFIYIAFFSTVALHWWVAFAVYGFYYQFASLKLVDDSTGEISVADLEEERRNELEVYSILEIDSGGPNEIYVRLFLFTSFLILFFLFRFFGIYFFLKVFFFVLFILYFLYFILDDFRSYEHIFINKLGYYDPRPGIDFFLPGEDYDKYGFKDLSSFVLETLDYATLSNENFDAKYKVGLLGNLTYLINNKYKDLNPYICYLSNDPYFFRKFLYNYSNLYVFQAIHNYWRTQVDLYLPFYFRKRSLDSSIFKNYLRDNSNVIRNFDILQHDSSAPVNMTYIRDYVNEFYTIDTIRSRIVSRSYESQYSWFRSLSDPFLNILICTNDYKYVFPFYKFNERSFTSFYKIIFDTITDESLLINLKKFILKNIEPVDSKLDSFALMVYNLFPEDDFGEERFIYWLTHFLSFFDSYISPVFFFNDLALPTDFEYLSYTRRMWSGRGLWNFLTLLFTKKYSFEVKRSFFTRLIVCKLLRVPYYPVLGKNKRLCFYEGRYFSYPIDDFLGQLEDLAEEFARLVYVGDAAFSFELKHRLLTRDGHSNRLDAVLSFGTYLSYNNLYYINDIVSYKNGFLLNNLSYRDNFGIIDYVFYVNFSSMLARASKNFFFKTNRFIQFNLFIDSRFQILKRFLSLDPSLKVFLDNFFFNPVSSELYNLFLKKFSGSPDLDLLKLIFSNLSTVLREFIDYPFPEYNRLPKYSSFTNTSYFYYNPKSKLRTSLELKDIYNRLYSVFNRKSIVFKKNEFIRSTLRRRRMNFYFLKSLPVSNGLKGRFKSYKFKFLSKNLSSYSTWSNLKFNSLGSVLLRNRTFRISLRLLLRDNFFLYRKRQKKRRKTILFRRFFWNKVFLRPLELNFRQLSIFSGDQLLCCSLYPFYKFIFNLDKEFNLVPNIPDDLRLVLFSNLRAIIPKFFLFITDDRLSLGSLWKEVVENPFSKTNWINFFQEFNRLHFDSSISIFLRLNFVNISNPFYLVQLDSSKALKTLWHIKNFLLSRFSNKDINYFFINSSFFRSKLFSRAGVMRFLLSLSSLVYVTVRSWLSSFFSDNLVGFSKINNFSNLDGGIYSFLEFYCLSTLDFNAYADFLLPATTYNVDYLKKFVSKENKSARDKFFNFFRREDYKLFEDLISANDAEILMLSKHPTYHNFGELGDTFEMDSAEEEYSRGKDDKELGEFPPFGNITEIMKKFYFDVNQYYDWWVVLPFIYQQKFLDHINNYAYSNLGVSENGSLFSDPLFFDFLKEYWDTNSKFQFIRTISNCNEDLYFAIMKALTRYDILRSLDLFSNAVWFFSSEYYYSKRGVSLLLSSSHVKLLDSSFFFGSLNYPDYESELLYSYYLSYFNDTYPMELETEDFWYLYLTYAEDNLDLSLVEELTVTDTFPDYQHTIPFFFLNKEYNQWFYSLFLSPPSYYHERYGYKVGFFRNYSILYDNIKVYITDVSFVKFVLYFFYKITIIFNFTYFIRNYKILFKRRNSLPLNYLDSEYKIFTKSRNSKTKNKL